jgi:hypothetical protein
MSIEGSSGVGPAGTRSPEEAQGKETGTFKVGDGKMTVTRDTTGGSGQNESMPLKPANLGNRPPSGASARTAESPAEPGKYPGRRVVGAFYGLGQGMRLGGEAGVAVQEALVNSKSNTRTALWAASAYLSLGAIPIIGVVVGALVGGGIGAFQGGKGGKEGAANALRNAGERVLEFYDRETSGRFVDGVGDEDLDQGIVDPDGLVTTINAGDRNLSQNEEAVIRGMPQEDLKTLFAPPDSNSVPDAWPAIVQMIGQCAVKLGPPEALELRDKLCSVKFRAADARSLRQTLAHASRRDAKASAANPHNHFRQTFDAIMATDLTPLSIRKIVGEFGHEPKHY